LIDLHASNGVTIAIAWLSVELARTAVAAIAINKLASLDAPVDHSNLPNVAVIGLHASQSMEGIVSNYTMLLAAGELQFSAG
jgi:hypothetical protein